MKYVYFLCFLFLFSFDLCGSNKDIYIKKYKYCYIQTDAFPQMQTIADNGILISFSKDKLIIKCYKTSFTNCDSVHEYSIISEIKENKDEDYLTFVCVDKEQEICEFRIYKYNCNLYTSSSILMYTDIPKNQIISNYK